MIDNSINSKTDGHKNWNSNSGQYITEFQEKNKLVYSPDPSINSYVAASKMINQNISRDALAKMPPHYQRPIFSSLSNQNKLRIYTEKIHLLLKQKNFNEREANHLKELISFAKPEYYPANKIASVSLFCDNWTKYATMELNWSIETIGKYVATFLTESELINNIEIITKMGNVVNAHVNCECVQTQIFGCNCSSVRTCHIVSCGILDFWECDGMCNYVGSDISPIASQIYTFVY